MVIDNFLSEFDSLDLPLSIAGASAGPEIKAPSGEPRSVGFNGAQ